MSRPLDAAALEAHPLPAIENGDKESKGRILVIAGSRDVPGAAILTATSAMRAGAGKLQIATVESRAGDIGVAMPEAMVLGLEQDDEGGFAPSATAALAQAAGDADVVVAGPGLASGPVCGELANALLRTSAALALDAAILRHLEPLPEGNRSPLPVLLPHAGELASLLGCKEDAVDADPLGCGVQAAERFQSIVLVKGVESHVVTPDGQSWLYQGGAPGLGVSGSGDVLAGIVGGLLARGAEPLNALLWSVWLHGEAGASLARKIGPIGFLAREIAVEVPALLRR